MNHTLNFNISDRKIQKSISQFRLSSHCLRIHTGRHERDGKGNYTPAKNRFCLSCKSGEIDDELHLLNSCNSHNPERNILFTKIAPFIDPHIPHSVTDVLSHILNSDDKFVINEFGKFLKIAFSKRKKQNS